MIDARAGLLVLTAVLACAVDSPRRMAPAFAGLARVRVEPRAAPAAPAPPTPRLRVATYNILGAAHGIEAVTAAIRNFDADVVALQEVDSKTRRSGRVDGPQVIADALGMQVAFAEHRRFDGGRIGVALLSRTPLTNVERIVYRSGGLAALRAEVTLPSGPIEVFVVHLHPTDPTQSPQQQARMESLRLHEATDVLLRATSDADPTIVLGDFNARSNGPEWSLFADHFTDACVKSPATWPATVPLVRIDYVWLSTGLRPIACPSFTPSASDHLPVVADVAVQG